MKLALVCLEENGLDPPLGLAYIASYLRKYGNFYNTIIVDKENIIERLRKEKPDVIGISAMTHEFFKAKALREQIAKEFNVPVIIGGHHITLMPSHFESSGFDIAVIGEGEQTSLELVKAYEKNGSFDIADLKNIKGIAFKDGKDVIFTKPRPFIADIDSIPFPARDLLKMKEHYINIKSTFAKLGVYGQMLTSRGCPYRCVFCSSSALWKNTRFHSARYVVDEIKEIYNTYGVDGIMLYDDLFIANKKRVEEIVRLLKEEGLLGKISFFASARANLVDEKTCELMKGMGIKNVGFGLESGSEKILKYLKVGTITVAQNREAIRLCSEAGLKTQGYFIIGSPEETEEDIMQTLELIRDKNLNQCSIFQLTPLPGTPVWEYAKQKGFVSDSPDFDLTKLYMSDFKSAMVLTDRITPERFKFLFDLLQKERKKKMQRGLFSVVKNIRFHHLKYILNLDFIKKTAWLFAGGP
jgi:radical SAM superfamily enzyme YgiQ (UPF0313 family)